VARAAPQATPPRTQLNPCQGRHARPISRAHNGVALGRGVRGGAAVVAQGRTQALAAAVGHGAMRVGQRCVGAAPGARGDGVPVPAGWAGGVYKTLINKTLKNS